MELVMIKRERSSAQEKEKEYLQKLKELEILKSELNKRVSETEHKVRSDIQRSYKDEDYDIHRRKLALNEDEQKVKLDKDRLALAENKLATNDKELTSLREEDAKLRKEN